ncbi:MAG: hypothetical protein ACE5DS_06810 [Kiloniellaceae bacterium]
MSTHGNIPDFAVPQSDPADAQEFARCLERAADLAVEFARQNIPADLNAAIAAAEIAQGADAAERALDVARGATKQAETLNAEVARFLSLAERHT